MARVIAILPYQWRSYWRGLRSKGLMAGANASLLIVIALLMLPGHFAACGFAALHMKSSPDGLGGLVTEAILLNVLFAWLVLPMLVTGVQARGQGIPPARLLQFPFSLRELFLVGVGSQLVQPVYWMLVFASALTLIPLAAGASPAAGIVAGLLFAVGSATVSWAIGLAGTAIFSSRRAREIAMLVVFVFFVGVLLIMEVNVELENGELLLKGIGDPILIADSTGSRGVLVAARHWTPAAFAVRAATGREPWLWNLALLALAAGGFRLSLWGLRRSLSQPAVGIGGGSNKRRAIGGLPGLPVALGVATRKELRYLVRTLDAILGFALGIGGAIWLLIRPDPSIWILFFGIPLILANEVAMPMNAFGLDRSGVDRYRLLPVGGREILLGKNLAFVVLALLEVLPLCAGAAVAFGVATGVAALLGAASYTVLMTFVGNLVSVKAPAPREFYNFDSKEQTGGYLALLYALVIWGGPGVVALATWGSGPLALVVGQVVVLAGCLLVYRRLLPSAGDAFDRNADVMRDRLAA